MGKRCTCFHPTARAENPLIWAGPNYIDIYREESRAEGIPASSAGTCPQLSTALHLIFPGDGMGLGPSPHQLWEGECKGGEWISSSPALQLTPPGNFFILQRKQSSWITLSLGTG